MGQWLDGVWTDLGRGPDRTPSLLEFFHDATGSGVDCDTVTRITIICGRLGKLSLRHGVAGMSLWLLCFFLVVFFNVLATQHCEQ